MLLHTVYQSIWVFFIYGFIGWCVEVIYYAVIMGKFINRGFLNGPICPIYGLGVLIVALCLDPVKESLILLFLGSILLTSALEFVTGFILERFFNDKWWDYSNQPFNLCGYICIGFSLVWGLSCVMVVEVIYPLSERAIALIPETTGIVVLSILGALLITDIVITLIETLKLKKTLTVLTNAEKGIRIVSDGIGSVLAGGTLSAMEKLEIGKEAVGQRKAKALESLSAVQTRLLNAYPRLADGKYREVFGRLKARIMSERPRPEMMPILPDSPKSIYQNLPVTFYRNTFETIIDVLEARDEYTAGHSKRVASLTQRFCRVLKLPPLETEVLEMAASVHDLGKVGVPDATLNKHGKLSDDEWTQMRRHPDIGADIILKCGKLDHVAEIVRHHHEHWDGSGYPAGLKETAIPKGAQIVSICDAVDSMMIARVYRNAVPTEACIAEIRGDRGVCFSPALADQFLDNWDYIVSGLYPEAEKLCSVGAEKEQ